MSALVAVAVWLAVNAAVVLVVFGVWLRDVLRDLFARPDRRRHIAECRARDEASRLDEWWALPTGEPGAW